MHAEGPRAPLSQGGKRSHSRRSALPKNLDAFGENAPLARPLAHAFLRKIRTMLARCFLCPRVIRCVVVETLLALVVK